MRTLASAPARRRLQQPDCHAHVAGRRAVAARATTRPGAAPAAGAASRSGTTVAPCSAAIAAERAAFSSSVALGRRYARHHRVKRPRVGVGQRDERITDGPERPRARASAAFSSSVLDFDLASPVTMIQQGRAHRAGHGRGGAAAGRRIGAGQGIEERRDGQRRKGGHGRHS